ncbi:MAG TPA: phosphate ABC transporter substrate-binding protein [Leptospiraceae bacterium]|nr:phosphate ABC transporter substrate-binding protein [Spirochaetaceae bacterium]HBS04523.1 phosphate ABC transporter substrate-binding protein [Leptospiraceae bacterium]|tara:strand:+ start:18092 stop:19072 length:981 start_codon:yes stop_codon:yes gene_type:complete
MNRNIWKAGLGLALISSFSLASCKERIMVQIDGSSTVYPITEAVAAAFQEKSGDVNVTVGVSGTGGGFKKFCSGKTDISDASRVIKSDELEKCEAAGINFIEIPVAYDGLAVLVNPENDFVDKLTVDELKKIFNSESPAKTWAEVREGWPEEEIKAYSPGKDSGTFDYFIEAIIGKGGQVRSDALFSEDDNTLVRGIAGDKNGVGFFGFAYYEENKDSLKLVPIVNPRSGEAVQPSLETVKKGTYSPLSRPLLIYVSEAGAKKDHVKKFVDFYLANVAELSKQVGYIPLSAEAYENIKAHFENLETGSVLKDVDLMGKPVESLYAN